MDLILWRHAEAEEGSPDHERALTPKGRKQAARMAKWLRKHLPPDTRIIASPATRAQQTAGALALPFETSALIDTSASVADHLKAAGWPKAGGSVLLVGHQPTLGGVAAKLVAGVDQYWSVKKGAVWWIEGQAGQTSGAALTVVIGPNQL